MLGLHLRNYFVHSLVRNVRPRVSKVVAEHHYYVFCSVDARCVDSMIVGYLNEFLYIISEIVLHHRHFITSIEKIEFGRR